MDPIHQFQLTVRLCRAGRRWRRIVAHRYNASLVIVLLKPLLAGIVKYKLLGGVLVVMRAGFLLDNGFGIGRTHDVSCCLVPEMKFI